MRQSRSCLTVKPVGVGFSGFNLAVSGCNCQRQGNINGIDIYCQGNINRIDKNISVANWAAGVWK